jgi:uncharacterized protein YegP (UPF0339 family)
MADVSYPCYWLKKDHSGGWYWIYYAVNGEEIARSSESYVRYADCEHGVNLVKASHGDPVFYTA